MHFQLTIELLLLLKLRAVSAAFEDELLPIQPTINFLAVVFA